MTCAYCDNPLKYGNKYCSLKCVGLAKKGNVEITKRYLLKLMQTPFEKLSGERRRNRVYVEQQGLCACCGLKEWQGKFLNLQLDHIDGDRKNNARTNLRMICPNCHSQTDTWGVGIRAKRTRYNEEYLLKIMAL